MTSTPPSTTLALMSHQRAGVELARTRPRFAFFWEPGTGKTILILAIVAEAKARGYAGKTLVLAPKSILFSAWAADAKHFPELNALVCWDTSAARRKKLILGTGSAADVLITTRECFKKHIDDFIAAGVTRLVVDESGSIKNIKSQIGQAAYEFSRRCDSVYVLSGTPAPNNQTEYFNQIRCVDISVFGVNFWKFAYAYFIPQKRTINGRECIIGWKMMERAEAEFIEKLRSVSWSVRKSDCLDLPPQVDVIREVELGAEEARAYASMLEELQVDLGDGETLNARAAGRMMKLRQITGGMVLGAEGGRATILGRSKLDELNEVLDEIGGRSVVIFAQFTEEITRIHAEIVGRGEACEIIDGRVTDPRVRAGIVARFERRELARIVGHPAAMGHGLTMVAAPYEIFFSYDYNHDLDEQARGRIHRIGQTEKTTCFYLSARGTIDEKMYWVLKHKKKVSDGTKELLSWLRNREGAAA